MRLFAVKCLRNLACNQSLSSTWRSVEQHAFAVLNSVLFNDALWIAPRVKGSSEYLGELLIETANPKRVEADVLLEDLLDLIANNLYRLLCVLADIASHHSLFSHLPKRLTNVLFKRFYLRYFHFNNQFAVA